MCNVHTTWARGRRAFQLLGASRAVSISFTSTQCLHHQTGQSIDRTKMPSTSFQPILDAAFADYAMQIGIDPTKHPFTDRLQTCHSPDDVLKLLQDKANEFKDYREGNRKLIDCLKPVVNVIHAFSGVLGEAVSLVSRIGSFFL